MSSWLQILRMDRIIVETIPLLERLLRELVVLLVVPVEHLLAKFDPDTLAVLP